MYPLLVKAFNYAFDRLSELDVPGLPKFEERQLVFARSDAKCIKSESYLQGSYKPDLILVKWDTFKRIHKLKNATYSDSYKSNICCKSGCDNPTLSWRSVLSTVEVKRGNSKSSGKGRDKKIYTGSFQDIRGDLKEPVSSEPRRVPNMVDEEYPVYPRTPIALCFPSYSHQFQSRRHPARKARAPHPRAQIGHRPHCNKSARLDGKYTRRPGRRSEPIVTQILVGPARREGKRRAARQWGRRHKGRIDHRNKHQGFKVQSMRATRYRPLSTSPTQ